MQFSPLARTKIHLQYCLVLQIARSFLAIVVASISLRAAEPSAVILPAGFQWEVIADASISEPLDLAFAPDQSLWVTTRPGFLWRIHSTTKKKHEVGKVPVDLHDDRCLHGIAFHPEFISNRQLYLFRHLRSSTNEPPKARLSTFLVRGNLSEPTLDLTSENVLLEFPIQAEGHDHIGGALLVEPVERKLYVSVGDNNKIADLMKYSGDPDNRAQNLNDLRGKTLRLNLDGSVPADNPYVGQPGKRGEIWTRGHRQPWCLNFDPITRWILLGENGGDAADDHDEVNRLVPGGNFGWPRAFADSREVLTRTNRLPGFTNPFFSYVRNNGASCTGALLYRSRLKSSDQYPARFEGGLFYSDYNRKSLRFVPLDNSGVPGKSESFAQNLPGGPVSLRLGPDGAIYLAIYGGWFQSNTNDAVVKIAWTASHPK